MLGVLPGGPAARGCCGCSHRLVRASPEGKRSPSSSATSSMEMGPPRKRSRHVVFRRGRRHAGYRNCSPAGPRATGDLENLAQVAATPCRSSAGETKAMNETECPQPGGDAQGVGQNFELNMTSLGYCQCQNPTAASGQGHLAEVWAGPVLLQPCSVLGRHEAHRLALGAAQPGQEWGAATEQGDGGVKGPLASPVPGHTVSNSLRPLLSAALSHFRLRCLGLGSLVSPLSTRV